MIMVTAALVQPLEASFLTQAEKLLATVRFR